MMAANKYGNGRVCLLYRADEHHNLIEICLLKLLQMFPAGVCLFELPIEKE